MFTAKWFFASMYSKMLFKMSYRCCIVITKLAIIFLFLTLHNAPISFFNPITEQKRFFDWENHLKINITFYQKERLGELNYRNNEQRVQQRVFVYYHNVIPFLPMVSFYNPCIYQNNRGFLIFSRKWLVEWNGVIN